MPVPQSVMHAMCAYREAFGTSKYLKRRNLLPWCFAADQPQPQPQAGALSRMLNRVVTSKPGGRSRPVMGSTISSNVAYLPLPTFWMRSATQHVRYSSGKHPRIGCGIRLQKRRCCPVKLCAMSPYGLDIATSVQRWYIQAECHARPEKLRLRCDHNSWRRAHASHSQRAV